MDNVVDIIICSDIHCRDFWKLVLKIQDKPIVFLGDYLDPYDYEGFDFLHGLDNLEEIIQFKKENPDRVTLLWGNHDCNSLWQQNWASRFQPSARAYNLYNENLSLFDPYKIIDNVLFTHAGISDGWYNTYSIKNITSFLDKQWNEFLQNPYEESGLAIFDCGRVRWGYEPYGGIFWNDLAEVHSNPIDYVQITGHNQMEETGHIFDYSRIPGFTGKSMYCCDSRAIFEYKNNDLKLYGND